LLVENYVLTYVEYYLYNKLAGFSVQEENEVVTYNIFGRRINGFKDIAGKDMRSIRSTDKDFLENLKVQFSGSYLKASDVQIGDWRTKLGIVYLWVTNNAGVDQTAYANLMLHENKYGVEYVEGFDRILMYSVVTENYNSLRKDLVKLGCRVEPITIT